MMHIKSNLNNLESAYQTANLKLSRLRKNDAEIIFMLFSDNNNFKYTDNSLLKNIEEAQKLTQNFTADFRQNKSITYLIFDKLTSRICGFIRFYGFDWYHKFADFSIFFLPVFRKNGYAFEALNFLFSELFLKTDLNRIQAQVYIKNKASIALLEKLDMEREGQLRQNFMIDGILQDSYMYATLRKVFFLKNTF